MNKWFWIILAVVLVIITGIILFVVFGNTDANAIKLFKQYIDAIKANDSAKASTLKNTLATKGYTITYSPDEPQMETGSADVYRLIKKGTVIEQEYFSTNNQRKSISQLDADCKSINIGYSYNPATGGCKGTPIF